LKKGAEKLSNAPVLNVVAMSIKLQQPGGTIVLRLIRYVVCRLRVLRVHVGFFCSRNIQNVVAKLESGVGSRHALLVNCHFDSVPQSPGTVFLA
jgi:hypothetical protein